MNCPKCGKEMEAGRVYGRDLHWSPKDFKIWGFKGRKDVYLYTASEECPPGWICRDCHTVILEYEDFVPYSQRHRNDQES